MIYLRSQRATTQPIGEGTAKGTMDAPADTGKEAKRKPADSRTPAARKVYARSRVSNGRDLLPDIDGRSVIARRYRDIASAVLADQGGPDLCSEARQQLIRRFAAAAVLAEQLESRLANGEEIDIAAHATLSSTLVRLAQRIGLDRRARDVTPSVADYIAHIAADEEASVP
jgi:hypothetical protein